MAGIVLASDARAVEGNQSAHLLVQSSEDSAYLESSYSDQASAHIWEERPGSFRWQHAMIFLPTEMATSLGADEHITLAGFWPSSGGPYGWFLQIHANAELRVLGFTSDGKPIEFPIYASAPLDRWVDLELGLHSQNGPGVKRAFAVIIGGSFYGWFHQGHMTDELYNRSGIGLIRNASAASHAIYIDCWKVPSLAPFPGGPDLRPQGDQFIKDFRSTNGENLQLDWSTWENNLVLDPVEGLYSEDFRVQAGVNLDRFPSLSEGWAEIEIGWPQGEPPGTPEGYFGPMIAFRKEINREENLEIVPFGHGDGRVSWVLEAWVDGKPVPMTHWDAPPALIGNSEVPEAGDILQIHWSLSGERRLLVSVNYFDQSEGKWYMEVIHSVVDMMQGKTNFADGFHDAVSITINSPYYSIRTFQFGTLSTWRSPGIDGSE